MPGIDGQKPTNKSTNQIKRFGQTAGAFGNDPAFEARGIVVDDRDLKVK